MSDVNLFQMLSAYRPGTGATPFDTYCTQALAYLLHKDAGGLRQLIARAGGIESLEDNDIVDIRPQSLVDGTYTDLLIRFSGGQQIACEIEIDPAAPTDNLAALQASAEQHEETRLVLIGADEQSLRPGWALLTWSSIADAAESDDSEMAQQFAAFLRQDVLGAGSATLDQILTTNRFYALAGAAVRRRFGLRAQCVNTASLPLGDRYRYYGTSFSLDGGPTQHWIGVVNETIPLSEHYDLMLASKLRPLSEPTEAPRTTADWRWPYWTTGGRVAGPVTAEDLDAMLERFPA